MTYDAAELARLRANPKGQAADVYIAIIDALEKAREELNQALDERQANFIMCGEIAAERDSARALLRLMMDDAAAPICRYERAILKELGQ